MFKLEVTVSDPEFAKAYDTMPEKMQRLAEKLHRGCVFQCLEALTSWMRVDTGRMRASFWPIMEKHGFTQFQRSTMPSRNPEISSAEAEGRGLGTFSDSPLNTIVRSNVKYIPALDMRTGALDQDGTSSFRPSPVPSFAATQPLFEEFFRMNYDAFMKGNEGKTFDQFLRETVDGFEGYVDFGQAVI